VSFPRNETANDGERSVMMGLEIEGRRKISFWDALMVQAAGSCGG
jgi:hypothetical protein